MELVAKPERELAAIPTIHSVSDAYRSFMAALASSNDL